MQVPRLPAPHALFSPMSGLSAASTVTPPSEEAYSYDSPSSTRTPPSSLDAYEYGRGPSGGAYRLADRAAAIVKAAAAAKDEAAAGGDEAAVGCFRGVVGVPQMSGVVRKDGGVLGLHFEESSESEWLDCNAEEEGDGEDDASMHGASDTHLPSDEPEGTDDDGEHADLHAQAFLKGIGGADIGQLEEVSDPRDSFEDSTALTVACGAYCSYDDLES